MTTTTEVDNFPGYPEGIDGPTMMVQLQQQAERFGTEVRIGMITAVVLSDELGGIHKVTVDGKKEIEAETIIISTGATAKYLGIPSEQRLRGGGVSACAVCDGFFYKDKPVTVLGGGDTALEEAFYLSNICSDVYVVHRRDTFRAAPPTIDRATRKENIHFVLDSVIEESVGDAMGLSGVDIRNVKTNEITHMDNTGLFVFVGQDVKNDVLKDENDGFICKMSESGQVVVDLSMKTSVPGLFVAGDLRIEAPKQVVSAAGDGSIAALQVISYIQEQQ